MRLSALISILRPVNAVVSGLTAVLALLIATGTISSASILLFFIVLCITGAGNIINDYFDVGIDRINRPGRPIPSGAISEQAALIYSLVLFLLGILLSFFTNLICIAIAVVNSIILIWYSARLKGVPLAGNLSVAYLAGSIFLFGAALGGTAGIILVLPITAITFLGTLAREILKDVEDMDGDRAGGASTLPLILGVRRTVIPAFIVLAFAICFSLIPVYTWGLWYLVLILPVDILIFAAGLTALPCTTALCMRESRATTLLKIGMFAALAVFTISAIFFW
ncbi:MAG: geranylgeranylglycerol-phosphate geranylgeranyltransferase [Methanoregulaceae archaeon]